MALGAPGTEWPLRLAQRRHWLIVANAALFVLWFGLSLLAYAQAPDSIPMHFTLDGTPTRFDEATLLRWLNLPLVTLGLVLVLPLIERADRWLNAQGKFARQERSADVQRLRAAYLQLSALLLIVAMTCVHLGTAMVAMGHAATIPPALLVAAALAIIAVLVLIIPLHRSSRRLACSGG